MNAIEFKVGNGKSTETIHKINEIMQIAGRDSYTVEVMEANGTITPDVYRAAANNANFAYNAAQGFIDSVASGRIDDGDIFDYINESGDTEFMNIVENSIHANHSNYINYQRGI